VQDDGDVMRCQIPGDMIPSGTAHRSAPGANVTDFSMSALDDFLDFSDRRRYKEV